VVSSSSFYETENLLNENEININLEAIIGDLVA
jgi:hypothetical protein